MIKTAVYIFGRKFLSREWNELRLIVMAECRRMDADRRYRPSVLCQQLLVSGEDHRHRYHPGYDTIAICRAIWRKVAYGRREGASTIDQQIVRVLTGRYERTLRRKFREIALAVLVKKEFGSAVLPAIYLRVGYYGWRMDGFKAASVRLGLDPERMSFKEAAELVARLKYTQPKDLSLERQAQITRRTRHLAKLYALHSRSRTYEHLAEGAVISRIQVMAGTGRAACPVS